MILETKTEGKRIAIDCCALMGVIENGDESLGFLYGHQKPIKIETDYETMKKEFEESKERNAITGELPQKTEIEKYDIVEVGQYKFSLNIQKTRHENNWEQSIRLIANFLVKNDFIKQNIEDVFGVEEYYSFGFYKYETNISVGRMFDIETVRSQVEQKLKECLIDMQLTISN